MAESIKEQNLAGWDTADGLGAVALGRTVGVIRRGAEPVEVIRFNETEPATDWVAEEVPVALVYNGISHAVMMTTPTMLEEFAVGFSLAEGIVPDLSHIYDVRVSRACQGMQVELDVSSEAFWQLKQRRRSMTGRTGCGVCGTESLDGVIRDHKTLPTTQYFSMTEFERSMHYLDDAEQLGRLTGCTHAAVWVNPDGTYAGGAEDVGRHVALDKLLGLRARRGWTDGALVISSRASYEMIQKAAACGVEIIFAVSAPTALAVKLAKACNITLAAFCRRGRCNVYSASERLLGLR